MRILVSILTVNIAVMEAIPRDSATLALVAQEEAKAATLLMAALAVTLTEETEVHLDKEC